MKKILPIALLLASAFVCGCGASGGCYGRDDTLTFTVGGVSFVMVGVEDGSFDMGAQKNSSSSPNYDSEANPDDSPVHRVTLSDYYIGQTEVTQALWKAVMGTTVREQRDKADTSFSMRGEGDNYPMYYVNYDEALEFIRRLNQLTGRTFRLPTEAEWEYAARGGSRSRGYRYSGSNSLSEVAWYWDNSGRSTHAVKGKQANELGLYDMSGNVYEWCSDWYGDYGSGAQRNPTGPASGSYRVLRGGSWFNYAGICRVSFRYYGYPPHRDTCFGFRLALSR